MNNDQSSSELFPEIQLSPPEPKTRKPRAKPVARPAPVEVSPAVANGAAADPESMARILEAHPDYRLLRRLKPCLQWPLASGSVAIRVVILDTETTGLDPSKDKIIELAILRVDVDALTGQPLGAVQVYDGLEDPGMPIPKEVVAITGLTDADVRDQRLDEDRIAQLLENVDVVIAHNAGFDRPFCESRLARFRHLNWACSFADMDWKAQGRGSSKLESLAQSLGLFYDAHRAEMDCHALLAVLLAPLAAPWSDGPPNALVHLLQAVQNPVFRLQATQSPFDAKDKLKSRGYRWNADQKVWHTRLGDEAALQLECAWLKEHVYNQRAAVVQVEKLDSAVKYSSRPGELLYRTL